MTEPHRRRAVEWFLTLHELPIEHALDLAKQTPQLAVPTTTGSDEHDNDTSPYDNGLSADEGLWMRTGWAGRG